MAQLFVAKELGLTLRTLQQQMTYAELWLWLAYFGIQKDREAEAIKKAQMRRR